MKILAFVDTHGMKSAFDEILKKSKDADVLVCAGDFTRWGESTEKWIQFLETTGKPLILIHGNHESDREVAAACKNTSFAFISTGLPMKWANTCFSGLEGEDSRKEILNLKELQSRWKKTQKEKSSYS